MKVAVIDCGSSKTPNICHIVQKSGGDVEPLELTTLDANLLQNCSGVIISGGPTLLTDPVQFDKILPHAAFLTELSRPILGICLGHQLLAVTHGANVFRGEERRDFEMLEIIAPSALFRGIESKPVFREDHCEGVTLPTEFKCLARSKHYPVEAMESMCGSKFGVQFHPEVSGDVGEQLLFNFLAIL